MPVKPSTSEEEYFARQEVERRRKIAKERHAKLKTEERERDRALHLMRCPKCGSLLEEIVFSNTRIDKCFGCEGIWLDKGEFKAKKQIANGKKATRLAFWSSQLSDSGAFKCGLHLIDLNTRTSSALTNCMFTGIVPCIAGPAAKGKQMRTTALLLASSVLFIATFLVIPAPCQTTSSSQRENENSVEGTVVSSTRDSLVVRTDDNQFHLFTYERDSVRAASAVRDARVRVVAGSSDENGTRVASSVTVLEAKPAEAGAAGTQAAPVPPKIREIESDIKRETRRWRAGVRAGAAFDPELFLFGVQSQMGPIFHRDVFFRPNAEFAFGEVTDLVALNLEAVYRFPASSRRGSWSPYVGAGPSLTFIHQNLEKGREIDFGNFDYETGVNVLTGVQFRRGTFVELKTSLYSGPAPKLRLIFGYNF